MMNIDTKNYLLGKNQKDLVPIGQNHLLHRNVVEAFHLLRKLCRDNGFDLSVASSYRSFERQKTIWNEKALGKRQLLSDTGAPLNYVTLSQEEILKSILRWSAIPGFSRHHWGTEIDVYCQNSLPSKDYNVMLIPDEVSDDGIFGELHKFLDELIEGNNSYGFFRPYCEDRGGVAPERWHLSYAPLSMQNEELIDFEFFKNNIGEFEIELKELLLSQGDEIFEKYIQNHCLPPF